MEKWWKSGGKAVNKDVLDYPTEGANNIGIAGKVDKTYWFGEGGIVSRFANRIPGVNAVAGSHDVMQINLDILQGTSDGWLRSTLNVPAMIPATVLTYTTLSVDFTNSYLISRNMKREY